MKRLGFFVICGCCCVVQAATPDITFHGTLVSPPVCTISGGKTIEVDFGDILINDIDGVNFRQTVPYEITCDSGVRDAVWEMTLTWKGTPTNYNTSQSRPALPTWALKCNKMAVRLSWINL